MNLGDGNATSLVLGSLGDLDRQDALVEAGGDGVLLDLAGEVEGAAELADAALSAPELGAVAGLPLLDSLGRLLGRVADSGRGLRCGILVLDGSLVVLLLGCVLGGSRSAALRGGRGAGSVCALDAAVDAESVGVGKLDVDVLLLQAREFSVELEVSLKLADIELGLEGDGSLGRAAILAVVLAGVGVKVLEETEKGGEARVGVVVVAREEGHCGGCVSCWVEGEVLQFVGWKSDNGV